MSNNSKSTTQHFYLRLNNDGRTTKHGTPVPSTYLGAPVGVVAFRASDNPGFVRVAASMVSRKDTFFKKTGVAKAVGLSKAKGAREIPIEELRNTTTAALAAKLGLYSRSGNYFGQIDWTKADHTKASALESFEARLALKPA